LVTLIDFAFHEGVYLMKRFVGIDLHKRLLVACILAEDGSILKQVRIEEVTHRSLERFCQQHLQATDEVVMEVTTHVWPVLRIMEPHVARVVASNPLATKAIAQAKIKTDKVDAQVLAQLLRLDYLPTVWAPDVELSLLREMTARRTRLGQDRTKIVNRIRTTLAMRLLDCPSPINSPQGKIWLEVVELDEDGRWLIDSDLRLLEAVEQQIAAIEQRLAQRVYQDDRVKLLMTLPGVGQQTAQAVVAAIGDINRFRSPEKLASYFGLVPSTRQSASKCHHGSITKAGCKQARWLLVEAAHCARRDLGPLGHFFNKVRRRKCYNVAVVSVARKLAMLCWHLLSEGKPYRYAKPTTIEAKLARLRVTGSGVKRRGGLGTGVDPRTARDPSQQHQRRNPGLTETLAKEGLPSPSPLKPGEVKVLEATGTMEYYQSIQLPSVRPKTRKSNTAEPELAAQESS
jgi:transposase